MDPYEDTDWDLAEGLDPDGPSADDLHRFGDEMTRCAACGREVYDQAEVCAHCGGFVHVRPKTPWWTILLCVALAAVLVFFWVL